MIEKSGIILGQSLLGRNEVVRKTLFPEFNEKESHAQEISDALEIFGYSIFLFLTGVKMDLSMLMRVGQKSWAMGVTTLMFPLMVGSAANAAHKGMSRPLDKVSRQLTFISAQQSFTSFPVVSCLLSDLKLLNSELGRLALSASLVSNICEILLMFVMSCFSNRVSPITAYQNVGLMILFLLFVVFVLRPAMKFIIKQTPEGRPVKDIYLHGILFLTLGSALLSKYAGQTILIGPLILGLAVPDGPPLGSALVNRLSSFFNGVLLPIYVTSSVTRVNLEKIVVEGDRFPFEATLIIITFVAKMAGSLLPPLICKIPFNDSMALALILSCKGIVELGAYRFVHDQKVKSSSSSPA